MMKKVDEGVDTSAQGQWVDRDDCPNYPTACRCTPPCVICGHNKHIDAHASDHLYSPEMETDSLPAQKEQWPPTRVWLPDGTAELAAVSPELENLEGAWWIRENSRVSTVGVDSDSRAQQMKPDIQPWLKEQCSRLMYGQCTTRRCIMRGGYEGSGGYDPEIATCEAYEISQSLATVDTRVVPDNDDHPLAIFDAGFSGDKNSGEMRKKASS